jgi:hypothetical protein
MVRFGYGSRAFRAGVVLALVGLVAGPGAGAAPQPPPSAPIASKLSTGPLTHHLIAHPEQAPSASRAVFEEMRDLTGRGGEVGEPNQASPRSSPRSSPNASNVRSDAVSGPMQQEVFNRDTTGLPQNEESVTSCTSYPNVVLEGTNDFRYLLDPQGNSTGWYLSTNGGRSVRREGLLPVLDFGGGKMVPSGGDPINFSDDACNLYAGDLNYDPDTLSPNGVGLYKTTPRQLARCAGGTDPGCWPDRTVVAKSTDPHVFVDKPWMHVGKSAGTTYIWVVYTEFTCPDVGCTGVYTSNAIKAVRCTTDLRCGAPQLISGDQPSIQFGDVTVGPDGRTYITWEQDNDLETNFQPPEHERFWLRVAPPGSVEFGPAQPVAEEQLNAGVAPLHANDFRVATMPKNDVKMVNGRPRVYVVWEGCRVRPLDDATCEEPAVKLRYSGDLGASWSTTKVLSTGGDNYFPTISANQGGRSLAVAWYTNRFDPVFHNRQDVELASVSVNGHVVRRSRLTRVSNESEADPTLGGTFIGDYIEVYAHDDRALVAYNANYRSMQLLGEGVAVPQQDNYLARHHM